MEVILLERVEKLGQMGDVVNVRPGFARNFLLPQSKALRATKGNLEQFQTRKTQLEADNLQRKQEAEQVSGKLDGLTVVLVAGLIMATWARSRRVRRALERAEARRSDG